MKSRNIGNKNNILNNSTFHKIYSEKGKYQCNLISLYKETPYARDRVYEFTR